MLNFFSFLILEIKRPSYKFCFLIRFNFYSNSATLDSDQEEEEEEEEEGDNIDVDRRAFPLIGDIVKLEATVGSILKTYYAEVSYFSFFSAKCFYYFICFE